MNLFKTKMTAVDDSRVTTAKRPTRGGYMLGLKHSEETKAIMRKPHAKFSEETKAKMRIAHTGVKKGPLSATAKANISAGSVSAKPVMTPNGIYPSVSAVARAANRDFNIIKKWMKRWPQHYYFIKDSK